VTSEALGLRGYATVAEKGLQTMADVLRFLMQPTFVLYVLVGLAIANLWRKRQESRGRLLWVTVPFLLLSMVCTPVAGFLAHEALEWPFPPSDEVPGDAQAIVVLAGYVQGVDATHGKPELGTDTLHRCLQAAKLHQKAKGLPILVSGGRFATDPDAPSMAQVMRDFLREQGVQAEVIVEGRSEDTYQNAALSSKFLQARGIQRIILVTDAEHMLRASACFRKQGMAVTASPVRHQPAFTNAVTDYLPNPREAGDFELATREWLAIAYYWVRGRL